MNVSVKYHFLYFEYIFDFFKVVIQKREGFIVQEVVLLFKRHYNKKLPNRCHVRQVCDEK